MNNTLFPSSPRVYLWVALGLLAFLNFQAWMKDYGPAPQGTEAAPVAGAPAAPATDLRNQLPAGAQSVSGPGTAVPATPAQASAAAAGAEGEAAAAVHVRTDVLDVDISLRGGTLTRVDLPAYPQVKGQTKPVRLENRDSAQSLYELQTGLTGPGAGPYPDQNAQYASASSDYRLGSAAQLRVPLTWSADGVTVTKTYTFRRGAYGIDVSYEVHNSGSGDYETRPFAQIVRNDPPTKRSYFNVDSYAYHGPAIYDGTKYRKLDPSNRDDSHLALEVRDGWLAALQHHFVSAIVPPKQTPWQFSLAVAGNQYQLGGVGPAQSLAPGASAQFTQTLFVGPKLQNQLEAIAPELGRVADYGRLWFLARPLFWLLAKVHALSGNWGIAIIFVTFLLKLLFYPLSEASGRSMAKMKTLQPRIKNLQETYKDDREKLGRAMMELYQREKINPVAGCLPIVIQIPVFIAFYWVLLESVEMRQAPFIGWIHDLSSRDPLFILPLIMAVAMFLQYKLNPTPPDPVQAKVFMFMPLVMSFMFAFFPAGLVLYWVTNTILSIAQQWNINRRIEAVAAAKRTN
ncbi:MAG TPA: membrane protein insertase YidC [Steroidobacteraceae bacterium]|nr:membrane protein insertase YidC [Steroidobacteraceae bacterium]